ncbi:hypothetical protein BpHYR1_041476 [Brachionus plicatilis]|uniref:Uncharacterized protein n=1 Tax=Brachionus plicatilis TaxID=10195 RepID=A0A3M7RW31_BRAPC|nr:hypothetical protein BpHYR1_041476 [Brachionus plicatilis]
MPRLERFLGHFHKPNRLIYIIPFHHTAQSQSCQSSGQSEHAKQNPSRRKSRITAHPRLFPHLHIHTHNMISQILWHQRLFSLAQRNIPSHQSHVQRSEASRRLYVMLMNIGDVLSQSQIRVSIGPVLDQPQEIKAGQESGGQLNILLYCFFRIVLSICGVGRC